jgi:hypothetical protein
VSALPPSLTSGDAGIAPHRLTGSQAEAIAALIPRLAAYHVTTRTLTVRAVDRGSPWVESFLTAAERAAIVAGIEETAPRPEAPAGAERGGGV